MTMTLIVINISNLLTVLFSQDLKLKLSTFVQYLNMYHKSAFKQNSFSESSDALFWYA